MPLPQVQSKSGKMFDADSPQGKMIVNAPKQPFKADSPALLQSISADVGVIKDSVGLLVSIAQTDARGDALSAADVPHNVQDEAELTAVGLGGGGDDTGGGGGGGFFSKLFGGAGGILAGAGLLVGGFGALLAGGGVLLKEFNNFDGEKFKKNIESIMSIVPSITSPGAAAAFAVDTGLFLITMTQLGLGMAAFGIGQGVQGIAQKFVDFDAQGIKDNVKILLSIGDEYGEGWAGKAAFVGESAVFLLAMTGLGAGLAIFGAGAAVGATGDAVTQGIDAITGESFAQNIKDNVKILLSIGDLYGDSWVGKAALVGDSAVFLLAMTGLGAGLAVFGAGAAVAATGDAITQGIDKITGENFAQNIKDNVKILLSIGDLYGDSWGGKAALVGNSAVFLLAMTGLGAGLAVFGAGATVGAATDAIGQGAEKISGEGWAQSIVDNVTTLLSISDLVGGKLAALKETGTFVLIMTGIAAGLAIFSFGAVVAGTTTGALDVTDWIARGEGATWSQSIVDHVTTLLSIASLPNVGADTTAFAGVMGGISAGLIAFSIGSFFGAGSDAMSNWFSTAEEGEGSWADKIKDKVMTLLSIVDPEQAGVTVRDATNFSLIMGKLSGGLIKFSGGDFVSSLLAVGSSVLNFLRGADSPVQEMLKVAESADELEKGANAIESLTDSLSRISALAFDGSKLNMKKFAEDLNESVPLIEAAIMGGEVDLSWLPTGNTKFKGLASPDIDFTTAIANIIGLRGALGVELLAAPNGATQQLQQQSSIMMTSDGPVTVIHAPNNSINQSSGDTNYQEMAVDHDDKSGSWWSRVDLTPWN